MAALTATWKPDLLGGVMTINGTATKIGSTTSYPFLAIRIHRNHPSVIIWSKSNEVEFVDGSVADKAKVLLKRMITVAHTEDSSKSAAEGIVIAKVKAAKQE
jgi:hypothetical protein